MDAAHRARTELETVILPFWWSSGIDQDHGGFHTCFDNRGRERTAETKFTWSQGRFIWLLTRAADLADRDLLTADAEELTQWADRGATFLERFAILPDGTCRFAVQRDGQPLDDPTVPHRSVYADLFVVMGLAELAGRTGDRDRLQVVAPVLHRAASDIHSQQAPTPPYRIPDGHDALGPHMILLNALLVLAEAESRLDLDARVTRQLLAEEVEHVMGFRSPDGTFVEMPPRTGLPGPEATGLVQRHRVPGHALEALWMLLAAEELLGTDAHRAVILDSVPALCELGWDVQHGGLLRYTDAAGPVQPTGEHDDGPYVEGVLGTWDRKLWWVHSEACATTAIAYWRYGCEPARSWFDRLWDYTLRTFPAGDEGREWIQIRDRRGAPSEAVVALPVKDPFHIARNLMQLVELGAQEGPLR